MSAAPTVNWLPECTGALEELLESMFFETLLDQPQTLDQVPEALWVLVEYRGAVSGSIWVGVTPVVASRLLVNFLGLEEESAPSDAELGLVTCELANMLCGCMLSRIDPEHQLDIMAPRLIEGAPPIEHCLGFPVEDGLICVSMGG